MLAHIFEHQPLQDGAGDEAHLTGEVDGPPPVLLALKDLEEEF